MRKKEVKNRIALLCLIIFLLLAALAVVQDLSLLRIRGIGVIGIYALIFLLPMAIYLKIGKKKTSAALRLHAMPVRFLPHVLVLSVAICMICGALNVVGYTIFHALRETDNPTAMVSFTGSPLTLALTMVVLPAVTEEFLFRGLALGEYESCGTTRAVLVTSLIFALFHANPIHLLSLFVAGICYAVLTKLFDSVWPAVIAHLLNNAAALLLYTHSDYVTFILSDTIFVIFAIVVIFLVLALAMKLLEKIVDARGKNGKLRFVTPASGKSVWSFYLLVFALGCIAKMVYTYVLGG